MPLEPRVFGWFRAAALLLAAIGWLLPGSASAFRVTYDGVLVSEKSGDPPVPVTLEMDVSLGVVKGSVETRLPLIGKGEIEGVERFGTCEVYGNIGRGTVLRMKGGCTMSDRIFEGTYKIRVRDKPYQQGTFRMTRAAAPGSIRPGVSAGDDPSFATGGSMTRCLDSNRMCLASCRTSNYNETLLCTSRCRRILSKCKAAVSGAARY
jgi:hypothetical protein